MTLDCCGITEKSQHKFTSKYLVKSKNRIILGLPYYHHCFYACVHYISVLLLLVDVVTKVTSLVACNLRVWCPVMLAPCYHSKFPCSTAHTIRELSGLMLPAQQTLRQLIRVYGKINIVTVVQGRLSQLNLSTSSCSFCQFDFHSHDIIHTLTTINSSNTIT